MLNVNAIDKFLLAALEEDAGQGDITTAVCVAPGTIATGIFTAKEPGVICGLDVCARVFRLADETVTFTAHCADGDVVAAGQTLAEVRGAARSILTSERVALNILQRLSGIAERTRLAVESVRGYPVKIADTRKTAPLMRSLEKYAVRVGGGVNHRYNLSDGVLIKDNHIVAAGGITAAVRAAKKHAPHTLKIEVEVETINEVCEALNAGADIIMLDNMSPDKMREAVEIIGKRAICEASGNMGDKNLTEVAATGVDIISIGALTHYVKSMDISLKFVVA